MKMLIQRSSDVKEIESCFIEIFPSLHLPALPIEAQILYTAKEREEIVGFLLAQVLWPDEIELLHMGVGKHYRRKGVGDQLMQVLLRHAQYYAVKKIFLEVSELNIVAQLLYKKHGFIECGRRKHYYSSGEDAILFKKQLQ